MDRLRFGWTNITLACQHPGSMLNAENWKRTTERCGTCTSTPNDLHLDWIRESRPNQALALKRVKSGVLKSLPDDLLNRKDKIGIRFGSFGERMELGAFARRI